MTCAIPRPNMGRHVEFALPIEDRQKFGISRNERLYFVKTELGSIVAVMEYSPDIVLNAIDDACRWRHSMLMNLTDEQFARLLGENPKEVR